MDKKDCKCDNCGKEYIAEEECLPPKNLWERIEPGNIVPSGECPDPNCGALCYPLKKQEIEVWIAYIEHQNGINLYAARTNDELLDKIDLYVQENWDLDESMPETRYKRLDMYFEEHQNGQMDFEFYDTDWFLI